jgi:hypothetical protein
MAPQWDAEEDYRETPAPATLPGDGYTPILVSLALGVLLGAAPGALLIAYGGEWWLMLLAMASTAGLALLWRIRVHDAARWTTERHRAAMRPADPALSAPVVLNPYQGQQAQRAELAARAMGEFGNFVRLIEADGDTTARRWERQLGRGKYQAFRDRLIAGGFAQWRSDSPKDGWQLTAPAAVVLAALTPTGPGGLLPLGD